VTLPTIRTGSAVTSAAAGSPQNITLPTYSAGDRVFVVANFLRGSSTFTVTNPTGWNVLASDDNFNTHNYGRIYWRDMDGSEGTTVAVTLSANAAVSAIAFAIQNYRTGQNPEKSVLAQSGSSAAPDPASLTPSWGDDDDLWLAIIYTDGANVSAYPTNYSYFQQEDNAQSNRLTAVAARQLKAASEDPGAYTLDAAHITRAYTVAVRGAKSLSNMMLLF
jgi:hypothetical protein